MIDMYLRVLVFSILNYFPYALLSLYPFRNNLRFSKGITVLFLLISEIFQCISFFLELTSQNEFITFIILASLAFNLMIYLIIAKAYWGRALFYLLVTANLANTLLIISKHFEGLVFSENLSEVYGWSYIFCIFITQLVFLLPYYFYLTIITKEELSMSTTKIIWKVVWLIPLMFFFVWHHSFYHIEGFTRFDLAHSLDHVIFSIVLLLGQFLVYYYISDMIAKYYHIMVLHDENYHLSIMDMQYSNIVKILEKSRVHRHDLRHHMLILKGYSDADDYEQLKKYLNDYLKSTSSSIENYSLCMNPVLNIVLSYFKYKCGEKKIAFECDLKVPEAFPISDKEITVIFSNLLENAFDACSTQRSDYRKISIKGIYRQNQFVFAIDNTFDNDILKNADGSFKTTKVNGSGIGTESVKSIIQEHQGTITFSPKDNIFYVSFTIPDYKKL